LTQSLTSVVHDLAALTAEEKELKIKKDDLRRQLFTYGAKDYEGKEHLLPTTTITVPIEFFFSTGLDEEAFLNRSFPTWEVIGREKNNAHSSVTYVLRKKPVYMPFSYEDDDFKLSKTTTEPTPEIDLETLKAERSELYEAITSKEVRVILDGDKLQVAIEEDQEVISILMRHTKYTRESQQRVGIKNVE